MSESGEDCYKCNNQDCESVAFRENGEIVDAYSRGNRGECESCGQSLSRGEISAPWEDGDNTYAYIKCPYCDHRNIKYGWGGDD